ncbi:DUF962 domain-containing protein [Hahella sp. HN01]|uniref:Mpo1 family 2-hydroxy fatty acid dioxygenase n=1 Tax=Hahella sp. HN01 TaxID=2847262 RepID=UPI001C1EDC16|nr:Mpo1-like protein [Hahella sp. HN01]MBU6955790.1 DUF962 domain-containing protein [Hahella sp. HN01]
MKTLSEHLTQYAAYHRDRRNIATHFIGIPMIVLSIATLLSRTSFELFGITATPAMIVVIASLIFYLVLDFAFALLMAALYALTLWGAAALAAQSQVVWLSAGIGLFVVGWVFQFIGHYYEGRKPAFVDDLSGLIIGPLFVAAEACFYFGLRREVLLSIEEKVGPPLIRDMNATHTDSKRLHES